MWDTYRDIVMVGLALVFKSHSLPKTLEGDAKSAAFGLCNVLENHSRKVEDPVLPWAVKLLHLSSSQAHTVASMSKPLEGFERSRLLKDVPYFESLLAEASVNNHRGDGKNEMECIHRAWESSLLQILRMLASMDAMLAADDKLSIQPAISADESLDRAFSVELDLSLRIREYRKSKGIPETVTPTNPLFLSTSASGVRTRVLTVRV